MTTPTSEPAPCSPAPGQASLLESAEGLWGEIQGILHDHLQLAALETRRAGESLVAILACAVVAGVLAASAWLGVVGVLALLLAHAGLPPAASLALVVLVNLLGVLFALLTIRRRGRQLGFPATLSALRGSGNPTP